MTDSRRKNDPQDDDDHASALGGAYRIINRMVKNSFMPLTRGITLLSICLILSACASPPHIYIASSYNGLPSPGTRVSVLGNNMTVQSSAETWLRDRDLHVIERGAGQTGMTPANGMLCPEGCEPAAAIKAGKAAGVDYVVLFRVSVEHGPEKYAVMINGFAVKSGTEIFSADGTEFLGSESLAEEDRNRALITILCHALATVWQYRPGGYSAETSMDYCHVPRPHA